MPSIYYGDEIGMEGFKDPYNRRPYKWNSGDTNLREAVRQLIKLRTIIRLSKPVNTSP